MSEGTLTFLMAAESAYGPTNNCIGVGAELLRMGHRVAFAAESSWEGKLAALGFEEHLAEMAPPSASDVSAGQVWIDFVRDTAPHFKTSTYDQITTVNEPGSGPGCAHVTRRRAKWWTTRSKREVCRSRA